MATDFFNGEITNTTARARKINNLSAIDIDRTFPATREGVGFLRAEVDGLEPILQPGEVDVHVPSLELACPR
jgi:hypothetical protein